MFARLRLANAPLTAIPAWVFKALALATIHFYQGYLSPLKGFSCAYRNHSGRASCSALGYRAIRRHGVMVGTGVLRIRLARCGAAYRAAHKPHFVPVEQRGSCDAPCDIPCDGSELGKGADFCNCIDCGSCDSGKKDKRRKERIT